MSRVLLYLRLLAHLLRLEVLVVHSMVFVFFFLLGFGLFGGLFRWCVLVVLVVGWSSFISSSDPLRGVRLC